MEFCGSHRAAYEKLLEDAPFELPKRWAWCKLGEICEILDAKRKPITKKDRKPGPYPYYGATCIQDYVAGYIFDESLVLLGEDGAKWGKGDKSAFCVEGKIWVNNHAHVLRPLKVIDNIFLSHALTILDLQPYITGTTVPKLNQERMCQIHIPLPPLTEQKRIVVRIGELFRIADSLGEAADGLETAAERLDKKILDLAIRGKLVPQDPNDEPASELLKGIAATSHKSPCKNHEKPIDPPFDIPESWEWVRLRELGVFCGGHTPSMSNPHFWGGDVPWVSSKDMKSKYITDTQMKVSQLGAEELKILKPGTLLMCTRSGILRRTFPIAIAKRELTINQDQRALILHMPDMAEYIYVALKSLEPTILLNYKKAGTTVESIIWGKFIDLPIPLPPLAEQKRIVAKVNELTTLSQTLVAV